MIYMAVCHGPLIPLVNIREIESRFDGWFMGQLEMVLIGIDPWTHMLLIGGIPHRV